MDEAEFKKSNKRRAGLLTKPEKELYLDYIKNGARPFAAAKLLGRGYGTIANSEDADPAFAAAVSEAKGHALCQEAEDILLDLGEGKITVYEKIWRAVWKDGEQVLDEKGNPVMRLAETKKKQIPPDKEALKTYLKAHKNDYKDKAQTTATMGETDTDAIKKELAEKFGLDSSES